ncbi:MAG: helix-turn-helix transcriptional regulator [bacterium]|nr:helix-turn-helix transcriptional regulator [bacterium]
MIETFGKKLRDFRIHADVGLRELARLIEKSPGYISDVEQDHVPPPSEDVILKIAAALNVDKKELLIAAQKMDPEISSYVAQDPEAADFLRMAQEKKFDSDDWDTLTKLAEAAKLGKTDKNKNG